MKYAVLGTGMVGNALATKLVSMGHDVMMGSRTVNNEKALEWAKTAGDRASTGTFADAARFGEVLLSCTQGTASVEALRSVASTDLAGKILIDVSNPLDYTRGMPPTLSPCNTDSLGERLQAAYPLAKVVKTLNTCNCEVMIKPSRVPGEHDMFICGNDEAAKEQVKVLLREFGWTSIIDLGGITNARATEQLLPLWIRLYVLWRTPDFNFKLVRA